MRLKGHRVVLFSDQPNISRGLMSDQDVNNLQGFYMQNFGAAGILSIDGFYYNQSDNIQDISFLIIINSTLNLTMKIIKVSSIIKIEVNFILLEIY